MWNLIRNESGQGMVEYGLIIAVVALVVVGGLSLLGGDLTTLFSGVTDSLGTSTPSTT